METRFTQSALYLTLELEELQLLRSFAKNYVRVNARKVAKFIRQPMRFPSYPRAVRDLIETIGDDVRYATLALAIERLETERIEGAFAELGVWTGFTSSFIHRQAPHRQLYLFDTFTGFPPDSLEKAEDNRFKDTSQDKVAERIGDLRNVVFRRGFFPRTALGLEEVRFALVMLDFDLYQPALDALLFFYPRLVPGGYFIMHDFNSPESDYAISRAANEFLQDKPESPIEIPDEWGSALFRKLKNCRQ